MCENLKGLLGKVFKDETVDLRPGRHFVDEVLVCRITGSVEKRPDEWITPTVSIPLVPTLALVLEKAGLAGDAALAVLTEAITEAMQEGVKEDQHIRDRMEHVERAIATVRKNLLDRLPKMHRSGRLLTKDLQVELLPLSALKEAPAAA